MRTFDSATLPQLEGEAFEEWLAEHDAEVKAKALREAATAMGPEAYLAPSSWLSERADRIEAGEDQ